MGVFTFFKDLKNLHDLYKADIEAKKTRNSIIAAGVTEDLVKSMVRQADTGVVMELNYPNGTIFRVTRTLQGSLTETSSQVGPGLSFKESF